MIWDHTIWAAYNSQLPIWTDYRNVTPLIVTGIKISNTVNNFGQIIQNKVADGVQLPTQHPNPDKIDEV